MMCMLQRTMHQINKLIMVSQLESDDELIKNKPLPTGKRSGAEADVCGETYRQFKSYHVNICLAFRLF